MVFPRRQSCGPLVRLGKRKPTVETTALTRNWPLCVNHCGQESHTSGNSLDSQASTLEYFRCGLSQDGSIKARAGEGLYVDGVFSDREVNEIL